MFDKSPSLREPKQRKPDAWNEEQNEFDQISAWPIDQTTQFSSESSALELN